LKQENILITGASGAIGAALAKAYARTGVTLVLHGRDTVKLDAVAQHCLAAGAQVVQAAFDITDIPALQDWVAQVDLAHPLDLVIINQGVNINIGEKRTGEIWTEVDRLLDVNLRATMALVLAVVPGMRKRGSGQIGLMSSLAAYFGLPMTPAYCASKAAIKAYGEALRGWLADDQVGVTTVMPGYVKSVMCDSMPGPKPYLWGADRAACKIKRGLDKNQARVSFPFPLNIGTWCLAILPADVSIRILRFLGYSD